MKTSQLKIVQENIFLNQRSSNGNAIIIRFTYDRTSRNFSG